MDRIEKAIEETTAALSDGLDAADLAILIRNGIEVAEQLDEVSGEQKGAAALEFASDLLDNFWDTATPAMQKAIADIDIPYVPEGVEAAVIDPLLEKAAPPILKHFVKLALPSIVDLVIEASKGGVQVNTALWLQAADVVDLLVQHGETITAALDGEHAALEQTAGRAFQDRTKALAAVRALL